MVTIPLSSLHLARQILPLVEPTTGRTLSGAIIDFTARVHSHYGILLLQSLRITTLLFLLPQPLTRPE